MMAVNKAVDLSGWYTEDEAAALLGTTPRTIRREHAAGKWNTAMRLRIGFKPQRVYDPAQVEGRKAPVPTELVVAGREEAIRTMRTEPSGMSGSPYITIDMLIVFLEKWASTREPKKPTLYVRLDEAAEISGLSVTCIRKLIKLGALPSIRDRAIKVARDAFDGLDVAGALSPRKAKK